MSKEAEWEAHLAQIKRVRHLLALAQNEGATPAEAKSAMAMARRICEIHNIDIHSLSPLVDLTDEEKKVKLRQAMAAFGPAFVKAFPGIDTRDYLDADAKKEGLHGDKRD